MQLKGVGDITMNPFAAAAYSVVEHLFSTGVHRPSCDQSDSRSRAVSSDMIGIVDGNWRAATLSVAVVFVFRTVILCVTSRTGARVVADLVHTHSWDASTYNWAVVHILATHGQLREAIDECAVHAELSTQLTHQIRPPVALSSWWRRG